MKNKNCYDLNCIDNKTKYVTAHLFVDKRDKINCVRFLSQIKTACYAQILARYFCRKYLKNGKDERIIFVCDGFENYKNAFNKLFYRIAILQFGVPIACKKYNLEHNNNPIERYNGKIADRIKAIRSGFKSFDDAKCFMDLRRTIHNFVNPNQGLNEKTPAEMAKINLELGRNKLLELIEAVAKS